MPDLPTLTVTGPQAQRCLDAWGSVEAYRQWLAASVRAYVRGEETRRQVEPLESQAREVRAAIAADEVIPDP